MTRTRRFGKQTWRATRSQLLSPPFSIRSQETPCAGQRSFAISCLPLSPLEGRTDMGAALLCCRRLLRGGGKMAGAVESSIPPRPSQTFRSSPSPFLPPAPPAHSRAPPVGFHRMSCALPGVSRQGAGNPTNTYRGDPVETSWKSNGHLVDTSWKLRGNILVRFRNHLNGGPKPTRRGSH